MKIKCPIVSLLRVEIEELSVGRKAREGTIRSCSVAMLE
jgi:hypothetical protein